MRNRRIPFSILCLLVAATAGLGDIVLASRQAASPHARRMLDGKEWTTENSSVAIGGSSCYDQAEQHCRHYGRLYTWESARVACHSLGVEWRLPTDAEWRQLARHYGGVGADSDDKGRAAYAALSIGGSSGFDALLGGGREPDGRQYARLEAHGLYWTASASTFDSAVFYNFGKGGLALNRQPEGDKRRALSVRCVRD